MNLPDGIVAFVKADCPTCVLVDPVLGELETAGVLTAVFSQDDPTFPASVPVVINDTSLEMSWHHDIETVPTLIKVSEGAETQRVVGWSRNQWIEFTGIPGLGEGITEFSPGCGSLSVDPDRVSELEAKFGDGFASRHVEFAAAEDPIEAMYDRGWSDGLPLVPPTPERVARMLTGTTRHRTERVAIVPPDLAECSVEKVAVNAVMAGCRPEYLPVVIAALEAACTDEFNIHGLLATTMASGPVLIVNGPIRHAIGMNSGVNVLGQGNRANSTIGRALQLVIRNVGGGIPGGVDRATHGNPGKLGFCFAEDEEGSPWTSLAVSRGFSADASTVTLFPGEGPRLVFDQLTRTADGLAKSLALALLANNHPRQVQRHDAVLVVSPEHAARFHDAGWTREQTTEAIIAATTQRVADISRGLDGIGEGPPDTVAGPEVTKFRPDGLHLVHAGGKAGLFSAVIAGWVGGAVGSQMVTKEITP
ncbi:MAG: thioredoxin [Acidimicrobiia bacterium]|nr:thioredoxin [Acidimicrobiia bacterium]